MNENSLKNYLIRDKVFLRELYEDQSKIARNRILNFASDSKLDTLIKFLHFLANGKIPIMRCNFELIQSHKKLTYLKRQVEKKVLSQKC